MKKILSNKLWYKSANQAVDIVVIKDNKYVLLIQRKDTGEWALPGGFIEECEGAFAASMRELAEETGLKLSFNTEFFYIGKVSDPRNTIKSWVETTAFKVSYTKDMGKPKAGDDAKSVFWLKISDLWKLDLYGSHKKLIEMAVEGI